MGNKGNLTRQLIRQQASAMFSEKGYTAVSMQDICTACGLSKGGLYRYYESKEHLFTDLLQELQAQEGRSEQMRITGTEPAAGILKTLLEHTRAELSPNIHTVNFALYEYCMEQRNGSGPEFIRAQFERGREILTQLIQYGVDRGEFDSRHPEETAGSILILLEGLKLIQEASPFSQTTVDGVFRQIWRMVGIEWEDGMI